MDGQNVDRLDGRALDALDVIVPNLHLRYSGVTATNREIAPRMARRLATAWLGRHRPSGIARLGFADLLALRARPPRARPFRIWHARRNAEMTAGLLLRALGWKLGLLFTSSAQRRHSWTTRFLINRMDAVIATSQAAASYLDRPATVIHHGVDPDLYRPAADRTAAWAATGLPGQYGIGCFGRVRAQKGTDVFIDAMCRLLPRYPDFTAVVVGKTTPEERAFTEMLQARVAAAGLSERIRFLGELPVEEVPAWYQRISIFAFTSRNEGFGLTLLEAMAAATALVAARAGAAETVVVERETGFLVPPGNVDALVAALEPLMRDPAAATELGRRARERAIAAHSIEAEADAIAAVYRTMWENA